MECCLNQSEQRADSVDLGLCVYVSLSRPGPLGVTSVTEITQPLDSVHVSDL